MPTNPGGALGSLDYPKEERRRLAIKSRENAPTYGNAERQKLINEIHQYILSKAPLVPELPPPARISEDENRNDALPAVEAAGSNPRAEGVAAVEDMHELHVDAAAGRLRMSFRTEVAKLRETAVRANSQQHQKPMADRLFTWAAVGLVAAIVALLVKKCLKSNGISHYLEGL